MVPWDSQGKAGKREASVFLDLFIACFTHTHTLTVHTLPECNLHEHRTFSVMFTVISPVPNRLSDT